MPSRDEKRRPESRSSRLEGSIGRPLVAAAMLCLATIVVYWRGTSSPFVFDGVPQIRDYQAVHQFWPPLWPMNQRLVGNITFALNHELGGTEVFGYHVLNIAIHTAAACVLFGIVRRTLMREQIAPIQQAAGTIALLVALVWAVHPLQTQAVTYLVQRLESLMGLFFLLTLYCFIRAQDAGRGWPWLAASLVCCYLGSATKEVAAMTPLVVLWYDRAFVAGSWRQIVTRRGLYYLSLAGSWIMLAWLMVPTVTQDQNYLVGNSPSSWEYLRSQPAVLLHYLRMAVWPQGQCLDYGWRIASSPAEIYGLGLIIVALLGLTVWAATRRPQLGFLGGWFFLILAPTSSFVPIRDLAFEHRMYLPLAAPIILAVIALHWLLQTYLQRRPAARAAPADALFLFVTPLALALALVSHQRTLVYASEESVWRDVTIKAPQNARGHLNLAKVLTQNDPDAARRHYEQALKLDPDYVLAHYNFGTLLLQQNELEAALAHFDRAIAAWPEHRPINRNRAATLAKLGRVDAAAEQYQRALELKAASREAHEYLGAYYRLRDPLTAAEHFRAALMIAPDSHLAHTGLAALLWRAGNRDEALLHYRCAAQAAPRNPAMQRNLQRALEALNNEE